MKKEKAKCDFKKGKQRGNEWGWKEKGFDSLERRKLPSFFEGRKNSKVLRVRERSGPTALVALKEIITS